MAAREDVDAVAGLIGPWLADPKHALLISALRTTGRSAQLDAPFPRTREGELAWAAGMYGGDGTTSACRDRAGGPNYRSLRAGLPQAAVDGVVPPVLVRFHEAVGGIGAVKGPYVLKNPWSRLPQYRWSVGGIAAVELVLEKIWPWLDEAKREQARTAIRAARAGGPHRPLPLPSARFGLS